MAVVVETIHPRRAESRVGDQEEIHLEMDLKVTMVEVEIQDDLNDQQEKDRKVDVCIVVAQHIFLLNAQLGLEVKLNTREDKLTAGL